MKESTQNIDKQKIIKRTKDSSEKITKEIKSPNSNCRIDFSSMTRHIKDKYTHSLASKKLNPLPKKLLIKHARIKLSEAHNSNMYTFAANTLENLIYNKNCHVVSVFKESMIMDYLEEFLKRYI